MALVNHNITTRLLPHALILLTIVLNLSLASFSAPTESETLLKFKDSLSDNAALSSWNASKPPCPEGAWVGVICSNGKVWGLKLQNMGLKGTLDMEILKDLPQLRTISVMKNGFEGGFPNIKAIVALKSVYLSDNKFSGEIKADAFHRMTGLKKFHAARNQFTGSIPDSLTKLPLLVELMLEQNAFTGQIPNFQQDRLKAFNVSGNQLDGPIPDKLTTLDATAFMGNDELCGGPLPPCPSPTKIPVGTIILCVLLAAVALASIFAAIIILRRRKNNPEQENQNVAAATHVHKKRSSMDMDTMEKGIPPDLLKASAEILGSGVFGSTFKAALGSSGQVMVVKRYRQMNNVGREEFQEHMRRLGRLEHTNLLPLVAFYFTMSYQAL